jgi:hypothetical protein
MKITLILPVFKESLRVEHSWSELEAFFQKWPRTGPIEIEVLFVAETNDLPTHTALHKLSSNNLQVLTIKNKKFCGRSLSTLEGIKSATGDIIVNGTLDFTIPMGDLLNLATELIASDSIQVIFGQRSHPTKKRFASGKPNRKMRAGNKNIWSQIYEDISNEKTSLISDATCSAFAFRSKDRGLILDHIENKIGINKIDPWFITPTISKVVEDLKLSYLEIAVNCIQNTESRFRKRYLITRLFR